MNLIRDSIIGIVSKIWTRFICNTGSRRALPTRNIDCSQVFGQIDKLNRVKSSESVVETSVCVSFFKLFIKLLGKIVRGISEGNASSQACDIRSRVFSGNSFPSWLRPPAFKEV